MWERGWVCQGVSVVGGCVGGGSVQVISEEKTKAALGSVQCKNCQLCVGEIEISREQNRRKIRHDDTKQYTKNRTIERMKKSRKGLEI